MIDPKVMDAMVKAALDALWLASALDHISMSRAIQASLLAAEARGYKLVGREATLKMLNEGWEKMFGETAGPTSEVWYAMHDAAPGWGDGK